MTRERVHTPERPPRRGEKMIRYLAGFSLANLDKIPTKQGAIVGGCIARERIGNPGRIDHTELQELSLSNRTDAWKDVSEAVRLDQWKQQMATYLSSLPDDARGILQTRLGIDTTQDAKWLSEAVQNRLFKPYLGEEKPNIARFAQDFLGEEGDIDAASEDLQKIQGLLGIFGGEDPQRTRAQNIEDFQTAIAAHMEALSANRNGVSRDRLM